MNGIDKLTSAQALALYKAIGERIGEHRKAVPAGEHMVTVRVEGEPVELLLTVGEKTKDSLLAPPYKDIATHLMGKVNQATIDALVAFDDIRTGRDQWRRGSRRMSVTVVEDSSEGRENG